MKRFAVYVEIFIAWTGCDRSLTPRQAFDRICRSVASAVELRNSLPLDRKEELILSNVSMVVMPMGHRNWFGHRNWHDIISDAIAEIPLCHMLTQSADPTHPCVVFVHTLADGSYGVLIIAGDDAYGISVAAYASCTAKVLAALGSSHIAVDCATSGMMRIASKLRA